MIDSAVMVSTSLVQSFLDLASDADDNLARAALCIARIEFPRLDDSAYLARLEQIGEQARTRGERAGGAANVNVALGAVNRFLFDEMGFAGNRERYDDPRNSCLNYA